MDNQKLSFVTDSTLDRSKPVNLTSMHRQKVFAYLYSFIADKDLCSDLTQETLLCAYLKSMEDAYEERGLILPWLKRIALCKASDYFRKTGRKRRLEAANIPSIIWGLGFENGDEIENMYDFDTQRDNNGKEKLNQLLEILSEDQRKALRLHYLENCTMAETAIRLQSNKNTITGRCRLGLKKLRKLADEKGIVLTELLKAME